MAQQTFTLTTSGDDQRVFRSASSTYPPNTSITRNTTDTSMVLQSTLGTFYRRDLGLLRFDTSALADTDTVTGAVLRLNLAVPTNADSRNLVGEWVSWDGTSASDYTDTPGNTAFSLALSAVTVTGSRDIPLSTPTNVSKTGYTYLRLGIDGAAPTGTNSISFLTSDNGSNQPQLVVTTNITVGATLSGVTFPLRHANLGPFISSAGNVYFFGRDATNTGQIEPLKATNPMSSFTAQTLKTMSTGTTTAIEAAGCYQVGDVIHIATQISTGQCFYNSYSMATDAWSLTTSETAVAASSFAPVTGTTFCDLVVRSGGEVVLVYNAGQTAMTSTFNMVRLIRRTGTATWVNISGGAGGTNVDNGGSVNWTGGVAALGASDRVHFFFLSRTNTDYYQRTLTAANALQTFPSAFNTVGAAEFAPYSNAIAFADSGTTRVRATFPSSAGVAIGLLDSSDAPSVSEQAVGATFSDTTNNQTILALANSLTEVHALWSGNATKDLTHDLSAGGGGAWGTDVIELAGTINHISAKVYTRSGSNVLAMVLDDNATIEYAEIALAAAPTTTLTQSTFRGRNDDGNETTATWKATAGTDWSQDVDTNFRVRFNVADSSAAATQNTTFQLRYSLNGGTYTDVTGSSSVVRATASANVTDGAATTEQLAGSGTFNAGTFDEADGSATGFTGTPQAGDDTEVEYCLQIRSADVVNNDTVNLRLYTGGAVLNGGYTDTPVITVSEAAAATAPPFAPRYNVLYTLMRR